MLNLGQIFMTIGANRDGKLQLRRPLAVVTRCLIGELEKWNSTLCARLSPLLQEFGAPQTEARKPSSPNVLGDQ